MPEFPRLPGLDRHVFKILFSRLVLSSKVLSVFVHHSSSSSCCVDVLLQSSFVCSLFSAGSDLSSELFGTPARISSRSPSSWGNERTTTKTALATSNQLSCQVLPDQIQKPPWKKGPFLFQNKSRTCSNYLRSWTVSNKKQFTLSTVHFDWICKVDDVLKQQIKLIGQQFFSSPAAAPTEFCFIRLFVMLLLSSQVKVFPLYQLNTQRSKSQVKSVCLWQKTVIGMQKNKKMQVFLQLITL